MKKKVNDWDIQQRFEAIFILAAIALIIAGFNGNTPLTIVGLGMIMLVFLTRNSTKKHHQ